MAWVDAALCCGLTGFVVAHAAGVAGDAPAVAHALERARRFREAWGGVPDPVGDLRRRAAAEKGEVPNAVAVFGRWSADGGMREEGLLRRAMQHFAARQARPRFLLVGGGGTTPPKPKYVTVTLDDDDESEESSVESGWDISS